MAATALVSMAASAAVFHTSIPTDQGLRGGDELISANGKYVLTLQASDGNLVVYRRADMKALWATYAFGGTLAVVQADGNFVVYKETVSPPAPLWHTHTNTPNRGNVALTLTDTGGLTLTYNGTRTWSVAGEPPCGGGRLSLYPLCITSGSVRYSTDWPGCDWSEAAQNARQEYPWATVNLGYCR